jgi:hypothetical protein
MVPNAQVYKIQRLSISRHTSSAARQGPCKMRLAHMGCFVIVRRSMITKTLWNWNISNHLNMFQFPRGDMNKGVDIMKGGQRRQTNYNVKLMDDSQKQTLGTAIVYPWWQQCRDVWITPQEETTFCLTWIALWAPHRLGFPLRPRVAPITLPPLGSH